MLRLLSQNLNMFLSAPTNLLKQKRSRNFIIETDFNNSMAYIQNVIVNVSKENSFKMLVVGPNK